MHRARQRLFLLAPAVLSAAGPGGRARGPPARPGARRLCRHRCPAASDYHLALWHGVNLPLLLSALVLAVGTARSSRRNRVTGGGLGYPPLGNADRIYDATLRGTGRVRGAPDRRYPARFAARRPSRSSSSHPGAGAGRCMLVVGARNRPELRLWDSPLQVVIGLMILAAALGATVMRNRLASVLLVGVTGYGCGVHLRPPRRARPRADPVPGGDTDLW